LWIWALAGLILGVLGWLSANAPAQPRKRETVTIYDVDMEVELEELILIEDLEEELEDEGYFDDEE